MNKFWKDILTEKDGETFELQRLLNFISIWVSVMAFFVGCTFEGWHVFKTGDFDLPSFMQAIAYLLGATTLLIAGGGETVLRKLKTESAETTDKTGK